MADIVRIFEDIATAKGLTYHYGTAKCNNLIDGSLYPEPTEEEPEPELPTFFLHEFVRRSAEQNKTKTGIAATIYDGKFFLVRHSDYDQQYFQEVGEQATSKYVKTIEPLLTVFNSLAASFACTDMEVLTWENIDITNALDANMDGLLCTYKVRVPN